MLRDFWTSVESQILGANEINVAVRPYRKIMLKKGNTVVPLIFDFITEVVHVHGSLINNEILLIILKEQPYYLGLIPSFSFSNKRTSAYAFDLQKIRALHFEIRL